MNEARAAEAQSPLGPLLVKRIRSEGPITFRDWMETALYHPEYGYYTAPKERWGRGGDYITSPQRSPLFAFTFARFFASLHQALGAPPKWTIIEAGAGAGDFAELCLQALKSRFPAAFDATSYIIDEPGAASRERTMSKVHRFKGKVRFQSLLGGPGRTGPCLIFTNELIDALPFHRVVLRGGRLKELYVTVDDREAFIWMDGDPSSPELDHYFMTLGVRLAEGQIADVNLAARRWFKSAADFIEKGYVVTVDYGDDAANLYDPSLRPRGSLRAYRKHRIAENELDLPGQQDLTASVCWTDLVRIGKEIGLETVSLEPLDRFLIRNGILDELKLAENSNETADAARLTLGARDMILPGGMAQAFQVLVQQKQA